jgi:hypothetical protein
MSLVQELWQVCTLNPEGDVQFIGTFAVCFASWITRGASLTEFISGIIGEADA